MKQKSTEAEAMIQVHVSVFALRPETRICQFRCSLCEGLGSCRLPGDLVSEVTQLVCGFVDDAKRYVCTWCDACGALNMCYLIVEKNVRAEHFQNFRFLDPA